MKVPKPKKLPSGNWRVRLRLGEEDISITEPTEARCKQKAIEIKSDYLTGRRVAISREAKEMTLSEAQLKYIKANRKVLSPATVRSYEAYEKSRFADYRNKRLMDIDFQKMIDDELEANVSEKTIRNAWGLVRPALKGIRYPVPAVKLAKAPVNEIAFLQPEEVLRFVDALKGRSYEIPALLELHGLRLSEVLGLTWENVDLKSGVIHVKGALVRGPEGKVRKEQNKNETSTRHVPIMIPRLLELLKAQEKQTGPVAVIGANTLLDDVKRTCKRAGVTIVTNHGLRHSFASLCYYLKIPERQIQEWGGWKDRNTLHKIYIRLTASGSSEAKDAMTGFFEDRKSRLKRAAKRGHFRGRFELKK